MRAAPIWLSSKDLKSDRRVGDAASTCHAPFHCASQEDKHFGDQGTQRRRVMYTYDMTAQQQQQLFWRKVAATQKQSWHDDDSRDLGAVYEMRDVVAAVR